MDIIATEYKTTTRDNQTMYVYFCSTCVIVHIVHIVPEKNPEYVFQEFISWFQSGLDVEIF